MFEKIKELLKKHKEEINNLEVELGLDLQEKLELSKSLPVEKQFRKLEVSTFEKQIVKAGDSEYLIIKGIASNEDVDRGMDSVIPSGIKTPNAINGKIPMLHAHDHQQIIGHWFKFGVAGNDYLVEGKIYKSYNPEIYEKVMNGDLNAMSIGFMPVSWERHSSNEDVLIFTEIELLEVSLVAVGMHQGARITEVNTTSEKSAEEIIKSATVSEEVITLKEESANEENESNLSDDQTSKISELESEISALKEEIEQLKTEMVEVEELLDETAEVVEQLREEKEMKYDIKN